MPPSAAAGGCFRSSSLALRTGAGEAYRRHCIERKRQREAQLKVLALQSAEECDFDFKPYRLDHAPVAIALR